MECFEWNISETLRCIRLLLERVRSPEGSAEKFQAGRRFFSKSALRHLHSHHLSLSFLFLSLSLFPLRVSFLLQRLFSLFRSSTSRRQRERRGETRRDRRQRRIPVSKGSGAGFSKLYSRRELSQDSNVLRYRPLWTGFRESYTFSRVLSHQLARLWYFVSVRTHFSIKKAHPGYYSNPRKAYAQVEVKSSTYFFYKRRLTLTRSLSFLSLRKSECRIYVRRPIESRDPFVTKRSKKYIVR